MSGSNFKAPPLSWLDVRAEADQIRNAFGLSEFPYFPIIDFIEKVLYASLDLVTFEVGTNESMNGAEGLTCPLGEFIQLREDVYQAACGGQGRARFTAAHELGHLILHSRQPLARIEPHEDIEPFRASEQQANQFAAELLMPPAFISRSDTPQQVSERHGVSISAATHRIDYLRKQMLI